MYPPLTKVDDFWEPAKKQLLVDAKGFMDSLVRFDKDNIPDRIIKKVKNACAYFSVRVLSSPFCRMHHAEKERKKS